MSNAYLRQKHNTFRGLAKLQAANSEYEAIAVIYGILRIFNKHEPKDFDRPDITLYTFAEHLEKYGVMNSRAKPSDCREYL